MTRAAVGDIREFVKIIFVYIVVLDCELDKCVHVFNGFSLCITPNVRCGAPFLVVEPQVILLKTAICIVRA